MRKHLIHQRRVPRQRCCSLRQAMRGQPGGDTGFPASQLFSGKRRAQAVHGAAVVWWELSREQAEIAAFTYKLPIDRAWWCGIELTRPPPQFTLRKTAHTTADGLLILG